MYASIAMTSLTPLMSVGGFNIKAQYNN